jgi:hypothetical protein
MRMQMAIRIKDLLMAIVAIAIIAALGGEYFYLSSHSAPISPLNSTTQPTTIQPTTTIQPAMAACRYCINQSQAESMIGSGGVYAENKLNVSQPNFGGINALPSYEITGGYIATYGSQVNNTMSLQAPSTYELVVQTQNQTGVYHSILTGVRSKVFNQSYLQNPPKGYPYSNSNIQVALNGTANGMTYTYSSYTSTIVASGQTSYKMTFVGEKDNSVMVLAVHSAIPLNVPSIISTVAQKLS